jgi:hypothetical protein
MLGYLTEMQYLRRFATTWRQAGEEPGTFGGTRSLDPQTYLLEALRCTRCGAVDLYARRRAY